MSIATDEALEWHGLHGDEPGDRDSTYSAEELYAAYIAGRTADVTDAEVKAAVRAMYYRHAADWESDDDYARHLLEAARKAVSE
jgi:hypothetical protein